MSYRSLEIWAQARDIVIDTHRMTLQELPKVEMYEEGSQIRRSVKSVKSNIHERLEALGGMLNKSIQGVEATEWNTREDRSRRDAQRIPHIP